MIMKKWVKRIAIGGIILILLLLLVVNLGIYALRFTDEDAIEYFDSRGFEGSIEHVEINGRSVKIVSEAPQESDSTLLVFVHGAPGTWDAFKEYVTDEDLKDRARIIAYDRPGYGGSGINAMPEIEVQAHILNKIISTYGLKKNILVGHSYGGPIAGYVGLDNGTNIDNVIMLAPLLDPVSEPLPWYSYFSYWKLTSWLLPSELVVAGSEKFAHARELEKMEDKWQNAKTNFVHVHGLEDGLAPGQENIDFAKRNIPEQHLETIVYPDKGHLIIWTDYDLIKTVIMNVLGED